VEKMGINNKPIYINTSFLKKQLDVISRNLNNMMNELDYMDKNNCKCCGGELITDESYKPVNKGLKFKNCTKCPEGEFVWEDTDKDDVHAEISE
jgi:hypothetical protein